MLTRRRLVLACVNGGGNLIGLTISLTSSVRQSRGAAIFRNGEVLFLPFLSLLRPFTNVTILCVFVRFYCYLFYVNGSKSICVSVSKGKDNIGVSISSLYV